MTIDNDDLLNSIMASLGRIDTISLGDMPNIDLYMDQLTTFMDERLRKATRHPGEDKILTKTMINNYAKNDLLPPPVRKKYSKDHLILLIFIFYLKNILSINENISAGGRIQKVERPEECALARPGRADDGDNLPAVDIGIDVFQHLQRAIILLEV